MKGESVKAKTPDRRVARTRRLLRDALHSLIGEKDYDEIVVKEILDRADVGRSAFYAHFRDKDELLASTIEELLPKAPPAKPGARQISAERLLWFSLPVFEHVNHQFAAGGFKLGQRARAVLHGHVRKVLANMILEQMMALPALRGRDGQVPADLLASYLATNFVLVLDWWVNKGNRISAREAEQQFRALVGPALDTIVR